MGPGRVPRLPCPRAGSDGNIINKSNGGLTVVRKRVSSAQFSKLKGIRCISETLRVYGKFLDLSGVFGEKTVYLIITFSFFSYIITYYINFFYILLRIPIHFINPPKTFLLYSSPPKWSFSISSKRSVRKHIRDWWAFIIKIRCCLVGSYFSWKYKFVGNTLWVVCLVGGKWEKHRKYKFQEK